MGNTQKGLNDHKNGIMRKESDVNSEDEKNNDENNFKLSEYDKELSRVFFDEENKEYGVENHQNKNLKKKKTLKDEIQSYADQIAEETFMEEINKSKSVCKFKEEKNKYKLNKYLNDDDLDEFNEFKRWKETQKPKNGKNNLNNNNMNNNNINIKPIHMDETEKIQEGIKKKNFQERINMFENHKNSNYNNNKLDSRTVIVPNNKKEFMKQTLKNYTLQSKTFKNEIPNNDIENYYNEERKNNNNNNNYTDDKQKADKNMSKTFVVPKKKEEGKSKKTEVLHNIKNKILNVVKLGKNKNKEKDDTIISKNIYQKMRKEDLKVIALYLKNGNVKYEQGLQLCGLRNYKNALTCFAHARNSYMQLKKMIYNNNNNYPEEFKNIINKKLYEKLQLVNQSIKECNEFLKKGKNSNIANAKTPDDILRKLHFKNPENININTNFSQIDDSFDFDFNSENNDNIPNPKLRGKNPNMNQNGKNNKNTIQSEDTEMEEKIATEIMQTNPGVKFSDIIGMQEMKKILYEIIIVPQIRPDLFTGIRKPQRGILLFGPPGTGKTMIAKAIASECNSTFFNISASSLTSKWVGESEKTVKSLFKLAYQKAPSIIFIDEIDSILSKRNESENEATKRLKTEFLIQFDGLGSNTNAKLLVIAATNRPMDLDEALLRRLPKRVYCGPLDVNGRFDFIKKVINRVETKLKDNDIMEIAQMTNGYSNSDLKELCKEAAFQPVRELTMEQILHIKKFRPIVKKDLVKAVKKIRGTMSNKIINELINWNSQFGGV